MPHRAIDGFGKTSGIFLALPNGERGMALKQTEMTHAEARGFDERPAHEAAAVLARAQAQAAESVVQAAGDIARGAELAAECLVEGGRLIYAAAGSSGLMALADALELPGTYGIPRDRIRMLLAGGFAALEDMRGGPEDDAEAARADVVAAEIGAGDCMIAVTASGSTPYPVAALTEARARGARAIGIANNPDVPLFAHADVAICLPTPPEVIAGSTRMGAGTAQKIALNMLSTIMAARLGHVHDGYMVNLVADNLKLRRRAQLMVAAISGVAEDEAARALELADGSVKLAVVLAAGASDLRDAEEKLAAADGRLRSALAGLHA
jgi:N-acetylmuramic acid 6-phosphate etherase